MTDDEKLKRYEEMQGDLQAEYAQVCEQMGELKAKGLEKKVTFKTLMARKLTLREMLNTYEKYGL